MIENTTNLIREKKNNIAEMKNAISRGTLMHKKDCQEIEFLILRPTAVSFFFPFKQVFSWSWVRQAE